MPVIAPTGDKTLLGRFVGEVPILLQKSVAGLREQ
jgi:hypothetical protein